MNTNQKIIDTIRVLSCEAIEKANSGHPGLPLGSAPIGYTLFTDFLKFNPQNPNFYDRDRFILSAGHGSMLLYSLLHLFGYDVSMEDIKNFRQLGSLTPGHPEYKWTPGVEISTGPLGQGIANAVGMAMAETRLAEKFNKDGFKVVDHYTYALCGDGCMMEGIEYEAASLAGTLKLGKLIVLYDKNNITIEGDTDTSFTEDVGKRHEAMGWQALYVEDGNDLEDLKAKIALAKQETEKPSLIICKTVIGYGSPLAGSEQSHGAPLGAENVQKLRENLGWDLPPFTVPEEIKPHLNEVIEKGKKTEESWNALFAEYQKSYPELAKEFIEWQQCDTTGIKEAITSLSFDKADATRSSGSKCLNAIADVMPYLFGGSADLGPSNKTIMKGRDYYSAENRLGSNMHFGIREHAMAAICNGMAAHGGASPYASTFFVFSDYMKNSIRLSALMDLPVVYIMTHDSIGVGEDGPTHQPVEQLVSLRSIPNLRVFRPADGYETAGCYISAFGDKKPCVLILSRQNLPMVGGNLEQTLKGAYVLSDSKKQLPDTILIATGSEVSTAIEAQKLLWQQDVDARVVSMPCMELFEAQSDEYKESVLPKAVRSRVCVEAASSYSWYKYAGLDGQVVTMDSFGSSAPAGQLFKHYGFTAENVANKALETLKK